MRTYSGGNEMNNPFSQKTTSTGIEQNQQQQEYAGVQYHDQKLDFIAGNSVRNPTTDFWMMHGDQLLFHLGQALIGPLMKGVQKIVQDPNQDVNPIVEEIVSEYDKNLIHDKIFHTESLQAEHQQIQQSVEQYQSIPTSYSPPVSDIPSSNGSIQPSLNPSPTPANSRPSLYESSPSQGYPPQQQGYPPQGQQVSTNPQDMGQQMANQTKNMGQAMAMNMFATTLGGFNQMANQKMNNMVGQPQPQQQQYQNQRY